MTRSLSQARPAGGRAGGCLRRSVGCRSHRSSASATPGRGSADQCSAANALSLITPPADTGWTQDGAAGLVHTPVPSANTPPPRYGTQANGGIRLTGELQWNNANGGSGQATMGIMVNDVFYAELSTSRNSPGQTRTVGWT